MKVFLYITSLAMGGAEQQCALLAASLKRIYGYDTEVIVSYLDRSSERLVENLNKNAIPIHGCPWKRIRGLVQLFRILRSGGKDSVLLCYNTFPNFWGGLIGRFAGLCKIYSGVRSEYLPWYHIAMDWFTQRALARGTIFNSYKAKDKFTARYRFSLKKSYVISNSISDTDVRHKYSKVRDFIKVITVGTFKPPKDYYTWLKTIKMSREKNSRIKGVVIGYGWQHAYIMDWIAELGLNNAIEVVDGKTARDIPKRLADADIYLSTSIIEGTSNSIMEGMRAALPIVATDVGDNSYLIQNCETGYICPVGDCNSLSAALLKLADDADLRKSFGERARLRMQENHSESKIAFEYEKIIQGQ